VACIKEKRRYIGFETDANYFATAQQRINEEKQQLELF